MQKLVHARALDLIGVTKGRDCDQVQALVLPAPLGIGENPRLAHDGTRLWNPDWRQNSTFPLNSAYLDAVANLILDQERVSCDFQRGILTDSSLKAQPTLGNQISRSEIIRTVRQYFRTLRLCYQAQTTDDGKERRQRKNEMAYRRNRKKIVSHTFSPLPLSALTCPPQKCNERRQQVGPFREKYGGTTTVGLEQIILTDYMSSEHSDPGKIDKDRYAAHRRRSGGGDNGLEIRRDLWHSSRVGVYLVSSLNIDNQCEYGS